MGGRDRGHPCLLADRGCGHPYRVGTRHSVTGHFPAADGPADGIRVLGPRNHTSPATANLAPLCRLRRAVAHVGLSGRLTCTADRLGRRLSRLESVNSPWSALGVAHATVPAAWPFPPSSSHLAGSAQALVGRIFECRTALQPALWTACRRGPRAGGTPTGDMPKTSCGSPATDQGDRFPERSCFPIHSSLACPDWGDVPFRTSRMRPYADA